MVFFYIDCRTVDCDVLRAGDTFSNADSVNLSNFKHSINSTVDSVYILPSAFFTYTVLLSFRIISKIKF